MSLTKTWGEMDEYRVPRSSAGGFGMEGTKEMSFEECFFFGRHVSRRLVQDSSVGFKMLGRRRYNRRIGCKNLIVEFEFRDS